MIDYRKVNNSDYCYINDSMKDTQEAMIIARELIALGFEMISDADKQKIGKTGVFDADAEIVAIIKEALNDYLSGVGLAFDDE